MDHVADRVVLLDRLSPWIKGKRCVEIGVLHGDYSAEILQRGPAELHLVDPWQQQPDTTYNDINNHEQEKFDRIYHGVVQRFEKFLPPADPCVCIHRKFSHEFFRDGLAPEFYRPANGFKFDFAFIDGNHSYAGVMADLFMLYPLMNPGGWICGHDYGDPSPFIGVQQAVISFCKITGLELGIVTEDPWASFGIQVKE